jgi:thiol-disulfide isomerase/thioredoxin
MKHDVSLRPSAGRRGVAAFALLVACAAVAAHAVPSDAVLRDFQPIGDYVLWVAGKEVPTAQIYHSELAPAFLLMSSALPAPVLLLPREGLVATVPILKVAKRPDGSIDLLADADPAPQGRFEALDEEVRFTVGGKAAALKPRPPLLGPKTAAALKAYSPTYGRGAQGYQPNGQHIARLRQTPQPVKVRIFFGSWCSFCKQYVPYVLKVEEVLKGSRVQFEYFGLPRDLKAPEAQRLKVKAVPTGIVYVNGREAGRISGDGWKAPEAALARIVAGA